MTHQLRDSTATLRLVFGMAEAFFRSTKELSPACALTSLVRGLPWPKGGFLPMIGQALGHYRIIEKIGSCGMGVVYRAHDEQLDERWSSDCLAFRGQEQSTLQPNAKVREVLIPVSGQIDASYQQAWIDACRKTHALELSSWE